MNDQELNNNYWAACQIYEGTFDDSNLCSLICPNGDGVVYIMTWNGTKPQPSRKQLCEITIKQINAYSEKLCRQQGVCATKIGGMTTEQRDDLTPETNSIIVNTSFDPPKLQWYNGATWVDLA